MTFEEIQTLKTKDCNIYGTYRDKLLYLGYCYFYQFAILSIEELKELLQSDRAAIKVVEYVESIIKGCPGFSFSPFYFDFKTTSVSDFRYFSKTVKTILEKAGIMNMSALLNKNLSSIKGVRGNYPVKHQISVVVKTNKAIKKLLDLPEEDIYGLETYTLNTPISDLADLLSVRAYNCLTKMGVKTLREIADFSHDELLNIDNLGIKTANELYSLIHSMKSESHNYVKPLVAYGVKDWIKDVADYKLHILVRNSFIDPQTVSLSCYFRDTKIRNQLAGLSISSLMDALDLYLYYEGELTKGTEAKFNNEILSLFMSQQYICYLNLEIDNQAKEIYASTFKQFSQFFSLEEINSAFLSLPAEKRSLDELLHLKNIKYKVERALLCVLQSNSEGLDKNSLYSLFNNPKLNEYVDELIYNLNQKREIIIDDEIYKYRVASIIDALKDSGAKHFDYCLDYLEGKTLEEIGNKAGVTRERIRQLIMIDFDYALEAFPDIYEDRFVYLYESYKMSADDFLKFTNSSVAYRYCALMASKRKNISLEEALNDPHFTQKDIQKLQQLYQAKNKCPYVVLDGEKVSKAKYSIFTHMAKTKYLDLVAKTDEWVKLFIDYCLDNSEISALYPDIANNTRIGEHYFSSMIFTKGGYRYYNFDRDFSKFLDDIKINSYHDFEMSTSIIYDKYQPTMEQYDIRNCYELHNLLRRLKDKYDIEHISFTRAPIISFDDYDRFDYYVSILSANKGITINELVKIIEKNVGISKAVATNEAYIAYHDFFDNVSCPLNKQEKTKYDLLMKDYYYTQKDLQIIFKDNFTNIDILRMGPAELKTLGLTKIVHSNDYFYIVKTREQYIEKLLEQENGIIDFSKKKYKGFDIEINEDRIDRIQSNQKMFHLSPNAFISIQRLNKYGVTIEQLNSYYDSVYNFVDSSYFFSITTLLKHGHKHELYDLGFDDYFYAKLLLLDKRGGFTGLRIGRDSLIIRKGNKRFSIKDVVVNLFGDKSSMSLDELIAKLTDNYGGSYNKSNREYKIIEKLSEAGFYYDSTMRKVYRSEEEFLRDIGD